MKTFVTYISKCRYFQQEICFTVSQSRALRLMKTIQQMKTSRHANVTDSAPNREQHTSLSSNLLNQAKRIQDLEL